MTLAEYSALQLPATPRILGVTLRPFALGHALLLARVGSPFMRAAGGDESGSERDSHPSPALRAPSPLLGGGERDGVRGAPSQPSTFNSQPPRLPGLGDLLLALEICRHEPFRLPGRARLAWLGWLKRKTLEGAVLDACLAFATYVREASTVPATWAPVGPQAEAPETMLLQALKLTLMAELGHPEAGALRVPLALALRDCFTLWAADGRVKLKTAGDAAAIAHLERMKKSGVRTQESGANRPTTPPHLLSPDSRLLTPAP